MLSEPVNSEKSDPPYCTLGWITLILFSILFIGSSIIYSKYMTYNEYI